MYYLTKFKKKLFNYFFDHPHQKSVLENTYCLIITILSAFIFSFGFKAFIQPNYDAIAQISSDASQMVEGLGIKTLASCGASGISQVLIQIMKISGVEFLTDNKMHDIVYWCFYLGVNLPLFTLGFFKVGKKFAIYSFLNVAFASFFGILLPNSQPTDFINQVTYALGSDIFARITFGGLCTGLASALSYLIDSTTGGTDIVAYYISEKKSVQVGKWSSVFNVIIVSVFLLLSIVPLDPIFAAHNMGEISVSSALVIFLFNIFYMIFVTVVVDTINIKNKKVEVQIITKNQNLSNVLIANIPHSCTIIEGSGGYTGTKIYIIHVSVRKREAKKVVKVCQGVDPNAFINVIPMDQIYGRFYKKPIK